MNSCIECDARIDDPTAGCPRCGRADPLRASIRARDLVDLLAALLGRRTRHPGAGRVIAAFLLLVILCYGSLLLLRP